MFTLQLILFALLWLGILYGLNCLIARRWKRIETKQAAMYVSAVAMIGVFGEIFLDSVYNYFVGNPLWRYNILPIHNAYTSSYAPVIWGLYGFHLYLLHDSLRTWSITSTKKLSFILSIEALILEALLTISARYLLGDFMYYYYPGDLWHVSSFQNIPFYFLCGVVIVKSTRRFKADPVFFAAMCACLTAVIVFMA